MAPTTAILLTFLLAALATTSPVTLASQTDSTNTTSVKAASYGNIICRLSGNRELTLREAVVRLNVAAFATATGASGFPHHFSNYEGFKWDNNRDACDAAASLLEMPVFADGHLYGWDTSDPRPYPGPARAVYFDDGGSNTFCGVVSHRSDGGYYDKCIED